MTGMVIRRGLLNVMLVTSCPFALSIMKLSFVLSIRLCGHKCPFLSLS